MAEPGKKRADPGADASESLAGLRERIDAVDAAILELLNERARVVQEVGGLKQALRQAIYSAEREREILGRLRGANPGPFPDAGVAPVFREIISATRSLEGAVEVAYLGPEGTFSHLAATEQFGRLAALRPERSIGDVFQAVERRRARFGVVPAENTTEGIVTETYDRLPGFPGTLCGELQLRIRNCLLSRSGRREDVRCIVSHPQPLAQCRGWLERHLPGVEQRHVASTAEAARLAGEDADLAAISCSLAAEVYDLQVVEASIEDRRDNTTRFLLLGWDAAEPSGDDLTCAVFTLRQNESGALHRLLEPFARSGVNLTSLQLRPIDGKPWEYLFFADIEGHASEPGVRSALEAAAGVAHSHRVLGSFPRARRSD